ncbi:MAG TPA: DUF2017 family protein, partial [Acidimicrobiales bacterium]
MRDWVRRRGVDRYRVKLSKNDRLLLLSLVEQLREQLLMSTDSPGLQRLFPPAYADDPERDAGYQVLTRDELLEGRLAALDVVESTLDEGTVELDRSQLTAWMTTINSLRLVLGTRLDIDEDLPDIDPDDPEAMAYAVYLFLT